MQLRADVRRIAEVLADGPHGARVEACPDWTVAELVGHLGGVHRWALHAVRAAERPSRSSRSSSTDGADIGQWLITGADALADELENIGDDTPSWNPFGVEPVAGFWPRRQAHETMVHRWDVETAAGVATPMPPELASDAIDEFFDVILPHQLARGSVTLPESSFHVHCTDVPGEWLVLADDHGALSMKREHAKGDAAARGPAEALLLLLWGRTHVLDERLDIVGELDVAAQWSRLGR